MSPPAGAGLPPQVLLEMHRRMVRIRRFEEAVKSLVKRGELPGAAHTSLGQEAEVVGACMGVREDDFMTGNHRSHGHPIGKGSPLAPLMAELLGKSTGICGGKGGSMHLADFSRGSLGESGVVGSAIPVATGAALSAKVLRTGRVSLCFFGDGASNQGVLFECMNMAAVWSLPVIFLCENNQYASTTSQREVMKELRISTRGAGLGVPGITVEDGQDVLAVHDAVQEAAELARRGEGPSLIEVLTYRYSDHSEGLIHAGAHRDPAEHEAWVARDPILLFGRRLEELGIADRPALEAIDADVQGEVREAVRFAKESPFPDPEDAFRGLFSEPIPAGH
ncbi:MAG: thiamine pyrophosphate-dependent dehydrogenase E1 component subunit alpha [Candidatus Dormibacteraceae bacterium]